MISENTFKQLRIISATEVEIRSATDKLPLSSQFEFAVINKQSNGNMLLNTS